jgi:hypothetical protein
MKPMETNFLNFPSTSQPQKFYFILLQIQSHRLRNNGFMRSITERKEEGRVSLGRRRDGCTDQMKITAHKTNHQ